MAWKERDAYANLGIISPFARLLPRHVVEPFYRANAAGLRTSPYGNDPKLVVGDGPYRLVEWRKGAFLTVEGSRTHPISEVPKIKRITWRFNPSIDAQVENLRSGAIDAVDGLPFDRAIALEREGQRRIRVFFAPSLTWEHIDFNLDNPLLQDVRVRRAIAHGVNRTQIVQQLFSGKQPVSHSYLPPRHPAFTDKVQKYPFDPARARALLREAGFVIGPDGIAQDVAGRRLSLEINSTAGDHIREQVERIIQEQLRQIGIEITIINFPGRILFGESIGRRKFKALVMFAWTFAPTVGCRLLYSPDSIPSEENGWKGQNHSGYRNPEMGRICEAVSREVDEKKRTPLLKESTHIFSRDLPALPLWFRVTPSAAKVGLQNFAPTGLVYSPETWNTHQWYWK